MAMSLSGKRVLITGASAGIGRAAVAAFEHEGAIVLAVARSADKLASLASSRVTPMRADVADPASMDELARAVLERYGAPDVVVANAGIGADAPFVETTDRMWREVIEVNVFGVVRSVRPFLPAMIARGSGRIVLVSSVVGKRGVPNYAAYAASKFALHGMADALRPELYATGVTLGIVCPSSTSSGFDDNKLREGQAQRRVRVQQHTPESVAKALVRMARSTRREMVLSIEGKFMNVASRLSPALMDWILYKSLVVKR